MTVLLTIAAFEIRQRLRRVSTWIHALVLFAVAYLLMITAGGAFAGIAAGVGDGGRVFANAPLALFSAISTLGCFTLLITAAIMGQVIHQDVATGSEPFFITSPIGRVAYLGGRFLAGIVVLALVYLALPLGMWIATLMPFLEPTLIGPNRAWHYLQPYLVSILPNLLALGAAFFAVAALARRIAPVYVGAVVLLIGYLAAGAILGDIENKPLADLLDPFGLHAALHATEYWTVSEKNRLTVPLSGMFLANRLLWLGVGAACLVLAIARFRSTAGAAGTRARAVTEEVTPSSTPQRVAPSRLDIGWHLRLLPRLAWQECRWIVASRSFLILVVVGIAFLALGARFVGSMFGTRTLPVTYQMIELANGSFGLVWLALIVIYAGEAVWREREARVDQLMDALPIPSWLPLAGKLLGLMLVQVLLIALTMACCVVIQAGKGYGHFEFAQYAISLFAITLPHLLLTCVLAVAVQAIVNAKALGHVVMVLYYLATLFLDRVGLEHQLWRYASTPGYVYSDMNSYGGAAAGIVWFNAFWAGWALLLALAARLLWQRGVDGGWRARVTAARARMTRPVLAGAMAAAVMVVATGAWILYQTTVVNRHRTGRQQEVAAARYEAEYRPFADFPHPRITSVAVDVDLRPRERAFTAIGRYELRNRGDQPVSTMLVRVPWEAEIRRLAVAGSAMPSRSDAELGLHVFELSEPIAPGASATLDFDLAYRWRRFPHHAPDSPVVANGTFISSTWLPGIGYDANRELRDEQVRTKHGLPKRAGLADPSDLAARGDTYLGAEADWIGLDTMIATDPDQTAIAPGDLVREWVEDGRRRFHYRAPHPVPYLASFLSARYAVRLDAWNGVAIEVHHHPNHERNVERMIAGMRDALAYCTRAFGPYQHRHLRIVEFPRYQTLAQSFPTTVPFSEGIGFIAKVDSDDARDLDYPYYVTAHEVAHQWWGHQAVGANVQGCTFLSETLAQYAALMVMKQSFGERRMRRFLRYELDRYLAGRGFDRHGEQPLARVEHQQYIHYHKGSLAMYALQDAIGEDTVNRALAAWLGEVRFQQPPYTTSLELLAHLRAVTPPDQAYLIEDLFETITLADHRARSATCRRQEDGTWLVTVQFTARKLRADGQGEEHEVAMDDLVDIGAVDGDGIALHVEKRRLASGDGEASFVVDRQPARAGIDPLTTLIDRKPDDNLVAVTVAP